MSLRKRLEAVEKRMGSGSSMTCEKCQGRPVIRVGPGVRPTVQECPACGGRSVPFLAVIRAEVSAIADGLPRTVADVHRLYPLPPPPVGVHIGSGEHGAA